MLALDSVSFSIEEGQIVAIVGGNGSGKTTLLKHFNGLLKPTSGLVKVFGRETGLQSVAELSRKVGLVFQNSDHQLFSRSVESEILFGLKNFGFPIEEANRRTEEMMDYFGLDSLRLRIPLTLSGGEKKRLCIAAVMAWNPEVLVLDEPTVGQDFRSKVKISEAIKRLVAARKTVVIVSHDLEFLWPLNARTIVMKKGRVLTDGDARSIFCDEYLLDKAGLRQPQLVAISKTLRKDEPFRDIGEAAEWLMAR